jgi:hypothetical protein
MSSGLFILDKPVIGGSSKYLSKFTRSPGWKEHVYKKMVEGFYLDLGVVPRQSVTLYGHFVELYSAFKQAIWVLSMTKGAAKCPSKYIIGEPSTDMFIA